MIWSNRAGSVLHLIRNAFDKVDYILRKRGTELVMTKNMTENAPSSNSR